MTYLAGNIKQKQIGEIFFKNIIGFQLVFISQNDVWKGVNLSKELHFSSALVRARPDAK